MDHKLIEETVDIYELPIARAELIEAEQVTLGDLHGNAIKLIFMLIKEGVASGLDSTAYKRMVSIYETPTEQLTKALLTEFTTILSQIKFNTNSLVRLIGDELADRGMNDYFTLKILQKMYEHNVPTEIILSNHGINFLHNYKCFLSLSGSCDFGEGYNLDGLFIRSMINLNQLLQDGKIDIEDLKSCSEIYLRMLKVLSYSLEEDGINPDKAGITIYSHALIGLYEISKLAQFFKVPFRDKTVTNLAATIDKINGKFRESLKGDQLFWDDEFDSFERGRPDWAAFINPLQFCIWNRDSKYLLRPDVFENFFLYFVHGHDITCSRRNNVYNLDNDLGKGDNSNKGSYSILHSGIKKKNLVEAIMESFESVDALLENLESELMGAPCFSKTPISHFFKRQNNGKKIDPAKVGSSYKPSLLKNEGNYPWLKTT